MTAGTWPDMTTAGTRPDIATADKRSDIAVADKRLDIAVADRRSDIAMADKRSGIAVAGTVAQTIRSCSTEADRPVPMDWYTPRYCRTVVPRKSVNNSVGTKARR